MKVPAWLPAAVAAGLLVAAPCRAGAGDEAHLSGKVSLAREGIAGARVFAYGSLDDITNRRHGAVSQPTGDDGLYRLDVPAGTWYLTARGESEDGDIFSFHGSNPFFLAAGAAAEVSFPLAPVHGLPQVTEGEDPSAAAVTGTVFLDGEPAEGARVKLYLDGESNFRGMSYAHSPPTGPDGAFRFDYLPEGDYWIVAHRRSGGAGAGPLGEGDAYGFYAGNPVEVTGGTETAVTLAMAGKGADTGGAEGRPLMSGTVISGRIRAGDGSVVPGTYAFAYRGKLMAHAKPDFLSREVDEEGRYVIHLSGGGTFYVGARSLYGDAPARGEWYGRYDGSPDHAVTVAPGANLTGVDIVVERIMP